MRIAENNDWVIFLIVGCIFLLLFMLLSLNREASLKDFILQNIADSSNIFLSWMITSLVFVTLFSMLISQYIPIVPKNLDDFHALGFQINKFGFAFVSLATIYLLKTFLSFLFFSSVGNGKKWALFYFMATKFYFVVSLVLIMVCIAHYYFPVDRAILLQIYLVTASIIFIFKQFFFVFNKNKILPEQWYYKFLYICTLQIMPVLVLWKMLFL